MSKCPECGGELEYLLNVDLYGCRACGYRTQETIAQPGAYKRYLEFDRKCTLEEIQEQYAIPPGLEELAIDIFKAGERSHADD